MNHLGDSLFFFLNNYYVSLLYLRQEKNNMYSLCYVRLANNTCERFSGMYCICNLDRWSVLSVFCEDPLAPNGDCLS